MIAELIEPVPASHGSSEVIPRACPDLVVDYSQVSTWPGVWYFARVNPQRTQRAIDLIENDGVPCYFPKYRERHSGTRGQSWTVFKPLFPSYLFFCVHHVNVLPYSPKNDWGVHSIREAGHQQTFRQNLSVIQQCLGDDAYSRKPMAVGTKVEICSGPMRGKVASVLTQGKTKLTVAIELMGQMLEAEIDSSAVEPL